MDKLVAWLYVIVAVAVALLGNYLAAIWASKENKFSLFLIPVILVSPFVFITFGLVTSRLGVAITSGTVDALLTIATVVLGLVVFQEWHKLSLFQYVGLACVLFGIMLIHFTAKSTA